jgi:MFS family permease
VFHVRLLTASITFFGIAVGMLLTATPQAAMSLNWESRTIGLIGACTPLGYALGSLVCGRFSHTPSKRLLLIGVFMSLLTLIGCFFTRTPALAAAGQLSFGFSIGFFFPVVSSWLLEFQRDGIARTCLLRHYNVGWTAGTAAGMFATGWLCDAGWVFPSYLIGAGFMGGSFLLALFAECRGPGHAPAADTATRTPRLGRVPFAILAAAIMANLMALGMRSMVLVNYPELNKAIGGSANQMGSYSALVLLGQLGAFSIGSLYEPYIGLRRTYLVSAVLLTATSLSFAFVTSPAALVPMALLTGGMMAMAFQAGIIASTGFFSQVRTGTTFFEFIVGTAGLYSFAGGTFVDAARGRGFSEIEALRTPFLAMVGLVLLCLLAQCLLVSRRAEHRVLLPETLALKRQERDQKAEYDS